MLQDIGHSVSVEFLIFEGVTSGLTYFHPCIDGLPKEDFITFDPPNGWTLESRDPLTVSPSLLCRRCGHHGNIVNGKWEPAV